MNSDSPDRLSDIETAWSLLHDAHARPVEIVGPAREKLIARYHKAVFGYLCGCTRDPIRAEDLSQEFWLKFLQGAFRHADPGTGSFRKYVKAALSHMVSRDAAGARRQGIQFQTGPPDIAEQSFVSEDDRAFQDRWQKAALNDAWDRLAADASGRGQYAALRLKADFPDRTDQDLAQQLTEHSGHDVSHEAFRKLLQRARERFAEIVYRVVAESLQDPTADRVSEELGELGLLRYCRSAVAKRSDRKE